MITQTREVLAASRAVAPTRQFDIDWLRIIAVFLLIPYHTARVFDIWEPFYVKNQVVSEPLTWFLGLLNQWHMPLLFILAGASSWFALRVRSGSHYVTERFKRLLLPLIFGLIIIVPPQAYLALLKNPNYHDSFFQFYPAYFKLDFSDLSGYFGTFTPAHLWFILFLFVYSLVALPLFLYLQGAAGSRWISRLALFFEKPGVFFLIPLLFVLTLALPALGGKAVFYYLLLFIFGFVLVADSRFGKIIDRYTYISLVLGVSASIATIVIYQNFKFEKFSGLDMLYGVLCASASWFSIVACLGLGHRFLNFTSKTLKYLSEASYPFYILHQSVILAIAYFVVQWDLPVLLKFLIIAVSALVVTLGLYDIAVKRTNLTRFLFGMKPLAKPPQILEK